MRQLTQNEINFVKATKFTPTVYQCDQFYLTTYTDERCGYEPSETYHDRREKYSKKWMKIIKKDAKERFDVDLDEFIDKNLSVDNGDYDGISLEFVATYLLYTFFTKEQLENLTNEAAVEFLQDYRYFFGFRKWYAGDMHYRLPYIDEAIEIYNGERVFYVEEDHQVRNMLKSESWIQNHPEFILKTEELKNE